YCRRHAKSCEPATPTVVRLNGLAPALPALHGAQAKQSPDRRPARASQLPLSASDSSCHGAADSTPVLLPESSLAHTTLVPPRKAESQLPLGGTRLAAHAAVIKALGRACHCRCDRDRTSSHRGQGDCGAWQLAAMARS